MSIDFNISAVRKEVRKLGSQEGSQSVTGRPIGPQPEASAKNLSIGIGFDNIINRTNKLRCTYIVPKTTLKISL